MSRFELPSRLPIVELPAGTELHRVHLRSHGAVWFNSSSDYRFNAPAGEYGMCYLGDSLEVSFLETLLRGAAKSHTSCRSDLHPGWASAA